MVNLNPNGSKGQSEERKKILNLNKNSVIKVIRRKSKSPDAADINDDQNEQPKISPNGKIILPKKLVIMKKSLSPPGGQSLISNFQIMN